MREILFRGKHVDNGEWIEGYYYFDPYPEHAYIVRWNSFGMGFNEFIRIDPLTVCQCTGLKDRNGDRIFEGDIVQIWWLCDESDPPVKYKAVVEFGNPNREFNWGYQLRPLDYILYNLDILLWVEGENDRAFCEIIGNIHDNPELLEVNNDVPV